MSTTGRTTRGLQHTEDGWGEPERPRRDWKKLFLVTGLAVLSWVATYVGMLELIEANMGELPLVHKVIIGFSVAMLMTMVVWLLDQMFAPIGIVPRLLYASGYLFLTIISVGFGFGFYWKVLESRSEASRSAEGAVGQVQQSLLAASTRLEQLQGTLTTLTQISTTKAQQETATGTSCPNSRPGEGPRRKLREDDAARFTFASKFVEGRVGQVKAEMTGLEADFAKISGNDKSIVDARSGTRNEFMKGLSRKLDGTVTGFNAFRTDPQLKQIRQDLAERADKSTFPDSKGGTFQCPDPQLAAAIKGVVRAIDELPVLEKPKIAAVEGSEATIEAFRRLTATFSGALTFKLPPSADEIRELQKKAVQSVEQPGLAAKAAAASDVQPGLSKRDYVPLAIAIFVDVCLLLVSMGRPMNRMEGLVPKMKAAEKGPVYQILSKFTDIHKDGETREKFELFRHVVFDFNGDYYVAVPLIAPYRQKAGAPKGYSTGDIEALQLDAHMLANLFASFEKEKIFTRVYNPFLSTRKIQDKLWRQGSKFAHAGAFRVYRFKDGAWSDMILGAVMGAAKRVDEQRRRKTLDELENGVAALPMAAAAPALRRAQEDEPLELPGLDGPTPVDRTADAGPAELSVATPTRDTRPIDKILERVRAPRLADFEADVSVSRPANNNTVPPAHALAPMPSATVTPLYPVTDLRKGLPSLRTLTDRGDRVGGRGAFETAEAQHLRAAMHEAPERFLAPLRPAAVAPSMPAPVPPPVVVPAQSTTALATAITEPAQPIEAPAPAPAVVTPAMVAEPRIDVTLVERRATYSIAEPQRTAVVPMAPTIEVTSPSPLQEETQAMRRLGEALATMQSPDWQREQRIALGGPAAAETPRLAHEIDEDDLASSTGPRVADDMTRLAERFRPAAVGARSRE